MAEGGAAFSIVAFSLTAHLLLFYWGSCPLTLAAEAPESKAPTRDQSSPIFIANSPDQYATLSILLEFSRYCSVIVLLSLVRSAHVKSRMPETYSKCHCLATPRTSVQQWSTYNLTLSKDVEADACVAVQMCQFDTN